MSKVIPTDRSRIDAYEKCPRLRFLSTEYEGVGLERIRHAPPLIAGTAIHEGVEKLLSGATVEAAVKAAVGLYMESVKERGIEVEEGWNPDSGRPMEDFVIEEQAALCEALIRGWAEVRLPRWQQEFDIIAIEKELDYSQPVGDDTIVKLMTRADLIVKRKVDGTEFVVNLKSTSNPTKTWREQWRYDYQTLSEVLPVEAMLGRKVGGVIIEGLVKGQRQEYPKGSGKYFHNSPLTWCWKKPGAPPFGEPEYASRYAWDCTLPHQMASGKECQGGKSHKLSGYFKAPTWKEPFGIKGWIEWLKKNDPSVLEEQFVTLPPIIRADYEIEEWKSTVLPREAEIKSRRSMEDFPKHTSQGNCLRWSKCAMFDICHGIAGMDPLGSGLYQLRVPNHPQEKEASDGL